MKFSCGACVPGFSPTSSLGYTTVTPSVFPPLTANLGMQNGFGNSSLGQLNSNAPGPIGKSSHSFPPTSVVWVRSVQMLPTPLVSPASCFHQPRQSSQWNSDALGPIGKSGQSFQAWVRSILMLLAPLVSLTSHFHQPFQPKSAEFWCSRPHW